MSGQWPPEWGEPDWDDQEPDEALTDSGGVYQNNPEFATVTAALAAVPMPAMPESVEARITAALAAESAIRAMEATPAGPSVHVLDAGRPRSVPPRRRRRFPLHPAATVAPVIAALVIGGFAYLVSQSGATSSSSVASGAPAAAATSQPSSESSNLDSTGGKFSTAARPPDTHLITPADHPLFVVTAPGTTYLPSTLSRQMRAAYTNEHGAAAGKGSGAASSPGLPNDLPSASSSASASGPVPASSAPVATSIAASADATASGAPRFAPSSTLVACVLKVTGGVVPSVVEYANYLDKPAFVIVLSDRGWIVGVGCTAKNPMILATVSPAG
jgi:hypothetical protein